MNELSEERLAEIERLTNERNNLKKVAQELLRLLIEEGYSDSVLMHYRWLLEPEPATATGVAEAVFGMSGDR